MHPNARAFIDGLVDRGVKIVVLDECHHLLDYWAIVLVHVLATRKENAEAFSRYWQRYVGGGTFVYTRTAEGRRMLLGARPQRRPETRDLAFEVWY